jgi:predicted enzyme related to lactoylglutathione lyase
MAHYSRLFKIVIDIAAADHDRELAFWSAAVGEPLAQSQNHPEYHGVRLYQERLGLLTQRLDDDGPARVHVDIHTDDLDAEVARLEALGAERVEKVDFWWVMRDPAGLPFCVIPQAPGTLDDSNAHHWD